MARSPVTFFLQILIISAALLYLLYFLTYAGNVVRISALAPPTKILAECKDHIDNDKDGFCDYKSILASCKDGSIVGDKDCTSKADKTEAFSSSTINPCSNGVKDGSETDIDCGGSCSKCPSGKKCIQNADCSTAYCSAGICGTQPPASNQTNQSNQSTSSNQSVSLNADCKPLKYDNASLAGNVNLIFVPSGFNGDMTEFMKKAQWVFSTFQNYVPFKNVSKLNAFYVGIESGSYCNFNCSGIDRLLCCDTAKALGLSAKCTGGARQTIVIHNNTKYGGAGYVSSDVATTSINSLAPKVAVHEVGHSLFNLGDEYTSGSSSTSYPNCDAAGCPKWNVMNAFNGVNCVAACSGGKYFTSETTIMKDLNYQFEEVNERQACCIYYQTAGIFPAFCDKFKQFTASGNLNDFCKISNPYNGSGAAPEIEIEQPYQYVLTKDEKGDWQVISAGAVPKGKYSRKKFFGDESGTVELEIDNGLSRKTLRFEEQEDVEYASDDRKLGGYVKVPRKAIVVIADHTQARVKRIAVNRKEIVSTILSSLER